MQNKIFSYRRWLWFIRNLATPEDSTVSRKAERDLFSMIQAPNPPLKGIKMVFWVLVSVVVSFVIAQL